MADDVLEAKGRYSRGYLPHCDFPELTQFITFRLYDSVPQALIQKWQAELEHLAKSERENRMRSRILKHLDKGTGKCHLSDPRTANLVQKALLHFEGERYHLLSWVIMPNHVHVLIRLQPAAPLSKIVQSWKTYTGRECNKVLQRRGPFWYREYYDRYIRNEEHYNRVVGYIASNPVKARLCSTSEDWKWSSAYAGRLEVGARS